MGAPPRTALVMGDGFIGSHFTDRLLADGWRVTTVDNFNPFYDPAAKHENIRAVLAHRRSNSSRPTFARRTRSATRSQPA